MKQGATSSTAATPTEPGLEPSSQRKGSDPISVGASTTGKPPAKPLVTQYQQHLQQEVYGAGSDFVVGSPPGVHDFRRGRTSSLNKK
ncbi:MAG: hypothetical protein JSR17_09245 [Proteobacteria bacterium]|nr:hypothetical protein [Pseudomonadota bacterium]